MPQRPAWLALAAVSCAVASCGSQVSAPVASRGTSPPTPTLCANAAYGRPCFSPVVLPSTTPSSIPSTRTWDVAFTNSSDGWALGTECVESTQVCRDLVDPTTDGGRTWGPPIQVDRYSSQQSGGSPGNAYPATPHIRIQGANMWISGAGIRASHDGGRTWVSDFSGDIVALEPSGSTAWAIGGCTTANPQAPCTLYTSRVGTDVWARAPVQPAFTGGVGGVAWMPVLERAPNGVAFIATSGPAPALAGQVLLFATRDDGQSWVQMPPPACTVGILSLRSPDGISVWALCGGGGGAGSGPREVFVSGDSGRSWQERANNLATPQVGSISAGGYARSLAVTGPASALIGSSRAGVVRSTDGGRTWNDVGAASNVCLTPDNGVSELWFVSTTIGWAAEENSDGGPHCPLLVRTTDGGTTWTGESLPPGWEAT